MEKDQAKNIIMMMINGLDTNWRTLANSWNYLRLAVLEVLQKKSDQKE